MSNYPILFVQQLLNESQGTKSFHSSVTMQIGEHLGQESNQMPLSSTACWMAVPKRSFLCSVSRRQNVDVRISVSMAGRIVVKIGFNFENDTLLKGGKLFFFLGMILYIYISCL